MNEVMRKCCWNAKLAYIQLYHQCCILYASKGGFQPQDALFDFDLPKDRNDILTMPGGIRDNQDDVIDSPCNF